MATAENKTPAPAGAAPTSPAVSKPRSLWQPLDSLHDEIDRVFDSFSRGFLRGPAGRSFWDVEPFRRLERQFGTHAPAVDLVDKKDCYQVTAELPGLDEKDVEVKVADGALTIKGEKKEEREEKDKNYYLSERRYGSFLRSFGLPSGIDESKIEAHFEKGVLTITLPKTAEAQKKEKKITITAK